MILGLLVIACIFRRTCRDYQPRVFLGRLRTHGRCFRLRREADLGGLMERDRKHFVSRMFTGGLFLISLVLE